ncbi:MAG: DUF3455 domain-containing protein [Rubrivivax sp.]
MKTPHWHTATALAVALLSACAVVNDALDPGLDQRPLTTVAARGVQIYECRVASAGAAPAWAFVAPDAELLDRQGRSVGTHGAGPHWTARDGSRVDGRVAARRDAPQPGAIPWLLLHTRSNGTDGVWSRVTAIQRLHTEGGVAPAQGCDAARLGQRAQVPYRADYRLFVAG